MDVVLFVRHKGSNRESLCNIGIFCLFHFVRYSSGIPSVCIIFRLTDFDTDNFMEVFHILEEILKITMFCGRCAVIGKLSS